MLINKIKIELDNRINSGLNCNMNYHRVSFAYSEQELGSIWSFYFNKPAEYVFIPGQYVFFAIADPNFLDFDAKMNRHCLSLSNSLESQYLRVTVDVSSGSYFKTFLKNLKQQDNVYVTDGMGIFTLNNKALRSFSHDNKNRRVFMIAGGVGITPFVSMITSQVNSSFLKQSILIHVSNDGYVFEDELKNNQVTQIRTTFYEIDVEYNNSHMYMIAGSPGFVDSIKEILVNAGIDQENILRDIFLGYN